MSTGYITKNYAAHGGNEWIIGGKLTFLEGAEVEGFPGGESAGTATTPAANQAASTATTVAALKEDFNTLLAALKTAGLMTADTAEEPETPDVTPEENTGESNDTGDTPGESDGNGEGGTT